MQYIIGGVGWSEARRGAHSSSKREAHDALGAHPGNIQQRFVNAPRAPIIGGVGWSEARRGAHTSSKREAHDALGVAPFVPLAP